MTRRLGIGGAGFPGVLLLDQLVELPGTDASRERGPRIRGKGQGRPGGVLGVPDATMPAVELAGPELPAGVCPTARTGTRKPALS